MLRRVWMWYWYVRLGRMDCGLLYTPENVCVCVWEREDLCLVADGFGRTIPSCRYEGWEGYNQYTHPDRDGTRRHPPRWTPSRPLPRPPTLSWYSFCMIRTHDRGLVFHAPNLKRYPDDGGSKYYRNGRHSSSYSSPSEPENLLRRARAQISSVVLNFNTYFRVRIFFYFQNITLRVFSVKLR